MMGLRHDRHHYNQISMAAALTYVLSEPRTGLCKPADEAIVRLLSQEAGTVEGAALVLFFFALAVSLPVCSFITGVRSRLHTQLALTALAASMYALAASGLGSLLMNGSIKWSFISLFFLWLIIGGACACLKEGFSDPATGRILTYIAQASKGLAAVSPVGVASGIVGFSWPVELAVVTAGAAYLTALLAAFRSLRTGRRNAETVLLGLIAVLLTGFIAYLAQSFGFGSAAFPVLWGLLLLLISFLCLLKLPVRPLDPLSSIVQEAQLGARQQAPTGGQKGEWEGKIASFAHEINTPLSSGLLTATHLQDGVDELYQQFRSGSLKKSDLENNLVSFKESAEMMITNLETAAGLVKRLRGEASDTASSSSQQFNINSHLSKVLAALMPRIKAAGHQMDYGCPDNLYINADPVVFSQIVSNLIINSLTHAFAPGKAGRLALEVSATQAGIRLIYSDDGKGIDKKVQERIFEPYFTTNAGAGNTGLGLFIVHSLVTRRLGGSIECSSTVGQGTTFTLHIPGEGS